jgi:hypothetical protein
MGQVDKAAQSKKSSTPVSRGSTGSWNSNKVQFVQYELDNTLQAACKAWELSGEEALDLAHKLCGQGYKFVLKQDIRNNCYACFMSTDLPQHDHANMVLAGRGSTPFKALKQTLYKHFTCLEQDWLGHVTRGGETEIDD